MLVKKPTAVLAYSSKNFKHYTKTTQTAEYDSESIVVKLIIEGYKNAIRANRDIINNMFLEIYKRTMNISENKVGNIYVRLKELKIKNNDVSVVEMSSFLREKLGYDSNFIRNVGGKNIPISIENISNAYQMTLVNKPITEIEKYLFL